MAQVSSPPADCRQLHPGLTVASITEAVAFYTDRLGFTLGFLWGDPPDMAGVNFGQVAVHLFADASQTAPGKVYFVIDNADEWYTFHVSNGVHILSPIQNKPYEMRDYHITDPFGNVLGFGQYQPASGPALKIERTELNVRIEKRLVALLSDLAEHKGMSIGATLEEILLHTCEPHGDGVASPHTQTTLRYIQELKKKHGITYDAHASYRFVE